METHQVIVANEQRLLRDMLERVLRKTPDFDAIVVKNGLPALTETLKHTEARWVIVSLDVDGDMPYYIEELLAEHPKTRFLAMAADGSRLEMKWVVPHQANLADLSLNALLDTLREQAPWEVEIEKHPVSRARWSTD
ncbi:MAG: hypothetical protein ACLFU8_06395 [Anaerolineales bacterium]